MVLLKKKTYLYNISVLSMNIKYCKYNILYCKGYYGYLKIRLNTGFYINIKTIKTLVHNIWFNLNSGWIGVLFLNGLGFKSTRKIVAINKKYWRFNVGHSHVFQYFTPKDIILKTKNRYIYIFGYNKSQVYDITKKIKTFHIPDIYKGVGIKFPNEIIRLKKGKMRQ